MPYPAPQEYKIVRERRNKERGEVTTSYNHKETLYRAWRIPAAMQHILIEVEVERDSFGLLFDSRYRNAPIYQGCSYWETEGQFTGEAR